MSSVSTRLAALPEEKRRLAIARLASSKQSARIPAQPNRSGPVPLSYAQRQFWILQHLDPASAQYNLPSAMRIDGSLDIAILERCLAEIVRRHDSLRTRFSLVDGEPMQFIDPPGEFRLSVRDVADLQELARRMKEHASAPFDLEHGALFRTELLRVQPREHVLLLNAHHIVWDSWSAGVLMREMLGMYESLATASAPLLPVLPIQYADFAVWQREHAQESAIHSHIGYWRERLSGDLPVLELPSDRPHLTALSVRGAVATRTLPPEVAAGVKSLSQHKGTTAFMTLLSAFKALLVRYTGQEDLIVGSPVSGRERAETQGLIGCFVNTLALRTNCSGDPSFLELMQRVRETCLLAYAHQAAPFELVVQTVQPKREITRTPVFQVAFGLRQDPVQQHTFGGTPFELLETHTGMAKFDLMLDVIDSGHGLTAAAEYNTDLFDAATIDRLLGHYETLLKAALEDPKTPISLLRMMSEPEAAQVRTWNDTAKDYPLHRCLHEFIEDQVERTPDSVAVVHEDQQITYRELDRRANQLAHYLRGVGVTPDSLVGVAMERSVELVVSLVAVLKAGGAYVPIDPEYPADRVSYMLADSRPAVLLSQQHILDKLPACEGKRIAVDAIREELDNEPTGAPALNVSPENLAYMIYTSGSTGRPKGAINQHRGIVNRLCWMQDEYRLDASDRVLQKTPFSFDVSVWEFFWPLMTGATLVVVVPGGHRDSSYLARLIAQQRITTLHFVPSMLQIFLDEPLVEECRSVRRVICSGEVLPFELEQRFFTRMKSELHNLYGPTEAAVDVTYWRCEPGNPTRTVPIGRPIANTQIHLLDSRMNPVPIGIAAELYIGGLNVGAGYLNRPELTSEKFIPDPYSSVPGARLYRTGDLARYLPNGAIDYLGRIDHQVKIRGFRIELGEIEAVLNQHPNVRQSVVVANTHSSGEKRLAAYLVLSRAESFSVDEMRQYLAATLPEYMVPAAFVVMECLPLSPNGKVDRMALPAPELVTNSGQAAPRDVMEQRLVSIWERVLSVRPIGVRDNFFLLGGNSLTALRLMAEVEPEFSIRLPVAALFQSPTIECLAPLLRNQAARFTSAAIQIQKGDGRAPFFFVPGGGGNMVYLTELARLLGSEQTLYGMRYRGLDGEAPPDTSVEVIAGRMAKAIRTVQASGPYRLGGHCFGGLIAFEIARQLDRDGEQVQFLAVVNTPAPVAARPAVSDPGQAQWIETIARAWEEVTGACLAVSACDLDGLDDEAQLQMLRRAMVSADLLPAEADIDYIRGLVSVFRANSLARYCPGESLPVPIALFRASEFHPHFDFSGAEDEGVPVAQSTLGWRRLSTRAVTVHAVPGNHLTMLTTPHIEAVARVLQGCLAETNRKCSAEVM